MGDPGLILGREDLLEKEMAIHSSTIAWKIPWTEEPSGPQGDLGSIPGSGRSPGEGNGNPLQYSCLENPIDVGACYSPWGRKESDTTE